MFRFLCAVPVAAVLVVMLTPRADASTQITAWGAEISLSASATSPFENHAPAPVAPFDSVHVWLVCAQADHPIPEGLIRLHWNAIGFLGRLISSNPGDHVLGWTNGPGVANVGATEDEFFIGIGGCGDLPRYLGFFTVVTPVPGGARYTLGPMDTFLPGEMGWEPCEVGGFENPGGHQVNDFAVRALSTDGSTVTVDNAHFGCSPWIVPHAWPDLAHWNRVDFSSGPAGFAPDDDVHALHRLGPDLLLVGGAFTGVRDGAGSLVPSQHVALWTGSGWTPYGTDLSGPSASVRAFAEFDGAPFAGGTFTSPAGFVTKLDGGGWIALGDTLDGPVQALHADADRLYAGGSFAASDGLGPALSDGVAAWDGFAWSSVGSGFVHSSADATVHALAEFQGRLVAGGSFDSVSGGPAAHSLAVFDGVDWVPLVDELDGEGILRAGGPGVVHAVVEYQGNLLVGGDFDHAGHAQTQGLALWDGYNWAPFFPGPDSRLDVIHAFTLFEPTAGKPELVFLGEFDGLGYSPSFRRAGRWNGRVLSTFGSGLSGGDGSADRGLAADGDNLYFGGGFTTVGGGIPSHGLAMWSQFLGVVGAPDVRPDDRAPTVTARPHPATGTAWISFETRRPADVRVRAYDVAGRLVEELHRGALPAGAHFLPWAAPSAPGPFFVRVQVDGDAAGTTKVIFLR